MADGTVLAVGQHFISLRLFLVCPLIATGLVQFLCCQLLDQLIALQEIKDVRPVRIAVDEETDSIRSIL